MTRSRDLLPGGVVHDMPADFNAALLAAPAAREAWDDITPLARNEWICWVTSPKKPETREKRVHWGVDSLTEGKRRPCCWPGCPHREKGGRSARQDRRELERPHR